MIFFQSPKLSRIKKRTIYVDKRDFFFRTKNEFDLEKKK